MEEVVALCTFYASILHRLVYDFYGYLRSVSMLDLVVSFFAMLHAWLRPLGQERRAHICFGMCILYSLVVSLIVTDIFYFSSRLYRFFFSVDDCFAPVLAW